MFVIEKFYLLILLIERFEIVRSFGENDDSIQRLIDGDFFLDFDSTSSIISSLELFDGSGDILSEQSPLSIFVNSTFFDEISVSFV